LNDPAHIATLVNEFQNVYSPATLLGVYAAAIRSAADGRLIAARGIYQPSQNTREYAGYFYDTLRGINDNVSIRLRVPSLLRSRLEEGQLYLFRGYMEKRVNYSAIELVFTVDELLQKESNPMSEEDAKRLSLLQQKVTKGYRDFEALVKESVYKGTPLRIANLYGSGAIVNKDFLNGLADALPKFVIKENRCNFASKTEIVRWLRNLDGSGEDVIAVVRGGGEGGLDIFNDPEICAEAIRMKAVLVTALGHAVNQTLLDKLADRKFDLPHHYGSSLRKWVDEATEEQARSKSLFIEQVKTDLEKTYKEQIISLVTQLDQNRKEKDEAIKSREEAFSLQARALNEQLKTKEESLKALSETYEALGRQQLENARAQAASEISRLTLEKERAIKQQRNTVIWLVAVVVVLAAAAVNWLVRIASL
jgi:exodeoxyribonuclease VII large subunit